MRDTTARIEEIPSTTRILLLFLFLVGAKRGEVEDWPASGARRRRSRLPRPLGGGSGGASLRRPRPGCRRGARGGRSRSGGLRRPRSCCHSGACHAALRLLARLLPHHLSRLAEAPPWLSRGLRWRRAAQRLGGRGVRLRQAARVLGGL